MSLNCSRAGIGARGVRTQTNHSVDTLHWPLAERPVGAFGAPARPLLGCRRPVRSRGRRGGGLSNWEMLRCTSSNWFELEIRIGNRKNVPRCAAARKTKTRAPSRWNCSFHLEKTFALKHDGEDVTNSAVLGLAGGDQFAEEILGGFPLNGFRRRRRRRMINTVPLRNEPFAVARALAVLRSPSIFCRHPCGRVGDAPPGEGSGKAPCRRKGVRKPGTRASAIGYSIRSSEFYPPIIVEDAESSRRNVAPKSSPKEFLLEPRTTRTTRKDWVFRWFGFAPVVRILVLCCLFAVLSAFWIGTDFESPYFRGLF